MTEENENTSTTLRESTLKVRPTAFIGFAVGIGYVVLFTAIELIMKMPYTDIGKTSDGVIRGVVIPMAVCAVVMAVLTTLLGWWRPVMREKPLGVTWLWAIPVLLVLTVAAGIDYTQLGALGAPYILLLALGTALVGFNEEIAYRGVALVAFRGQYKEVGVWFWTSLMFGLLHGANVLLGQPLAPTIRQVVMAFLLGTVFYAARRVTGSLPFLMVVHALWDFGSLGYQGGLAATGKAVFNPAAFATIPVILASLIMIAIAAKKVFRTPAQSVL